MMQDSDGNVLKCDAKMEEFIRKDLINEKNIKKHIIKRCLMWGRRDQY